MDFFFFFCSWNNKTKESGYSSTCVCRVSPALKSPGSYLYTSFLENKQSSDRDKDCFSLSLFLCVCVCLLLCVLKILKKNKFLFFLKIPFFFFFFFRVANTQAQSINISVTNNPPPSYGSRPDLIIQSPLSFFCLFVPEVYTNLKWEAS